MPRVSVLMPTFCRNSSGHLAKAIRSVCAQTFTDFEFFIVDDGSSDGSADTIQSFAAKDSRIKHIRFEKNVGLPAITTATAVKQSSGEFIAWIFDDCEWEPTYLQEMVKALDSNPDASLAYCMCEAIQNSDKPVIYGRPPDYKLLRSGVNYIANCATFFRRALVDKIGWYDPRIIFVRTCDWDFLSRASYVTPFIYVRKLLTCEHGQSLSNSLGNTYSVDFNLMHESSLCARPELALDRIQGLDILSIPSAIEITDQLLESHLRLCIEFALIRSRSEMFLDIARMPHFKKFVTDAPSPSFGLMFQWWVRSIKEASETEIRKRDLVIQDMIKHKPITSKIIREIKKGLKKFWRLLTGTPSHKEARP